MIKDPRFTSETRTVNLLERWSEEVCARIKWDAPFVKETSKQPVQKKVKVVEKARKLEDVTGSKEDSELTDEDDVTLLKAVKYPREVKKPKIEPAEKPKVQPKVKAEKAIKVAKPSSANGLGNFFIRTLSAICPQFIRIIRNLSAVYPHYPQFVRNLSALSAMCPHCVRTQPMHLALQQT